MTGTLPELKKKKGITRGLSGDLTRLTKDINVFMERADASEAKAKITLILGVELVGGENIIFCKRLNELESINDHMYELYDESLDIEQIAGDNDEYSESMETLVAKVEDLIKFTSRLSSMNHTNPAGVKLPPEIWG